MNMVQMKFKCLVVKTLSSYATKQKTDRSCLLWLINICTHGQMIMYTKIASSIQFVSAGNFPSDYKTSVKTEIF